MHWMIEQWHVITSLNMQKETKEKDFSVNDKIFFFFLILYVMQYKREAKGHKRKDLASSFMQSAKKKLDFEYQTRTCKETKDKF